MYRIYFDHIHLPFSLLISLSLPYGISLLPNPPLSYYYAYIFNNPVSLDRVACIVWMWGYLLDPGQLNSGYTSGEDIQFMRECHFIFIFYNSSVKMSYIGSLKLLNMNGSLHVWFPRNAVDFLSAVLWTTFPVGPLDLAMPFSCLS